MTKLTTNLYGDLAFLSYPAEAPIREVLEFLTDVIVSYNGSEQRLQLRTKPRQTFEYEMPLPPSAQAEAFNTVYGALRKRWAVPVWTEGQYLGTVGSVLRLDCDTANYDLRPSSLALLFASSSNWQVVEIATVDPTGVVLREAPLPMTGAYLLPLRVGYIDGNGHKPTSGYNGRLRLRFEIEDNPSIDPTVPAQYDGSDIYFEPGLLDGGMLDAAFEQRVDRVDMELGPVARRTPWQNARYAKPYRLIRQGAAEVRGFKDFVFRRAGRYRGFWMPTFENNLRVLNTGVVGSVLIAHKDTATDYGLRSRVAFEVGGAWHVRTLSQPVNLDGDRVQFTLDTALNQRADRIARASFLGFHRFDTDRIEISWIGNGAIDASIRIMELNA